MTFLKALVVGMALCLLIGTVSANVLTYQVQGQHDGYTVTLIDGGIGYVSDGERTARFSWSTGKNNQYEAHYWWITIPFEITGNKLTSSKFPNDVATLT